MGSISGGGLNPAVASGLYLANAASDQVMTGKPNQTHVFFYKPKPKINGCSACLSVCVSLSVSVLSLLITLICLHPHQVKHAWIYWLGPCLGALAAVLMAELLSPLSGSALASLDDAVADAEVEGEAEAQGDEETGREKEGGGAVAAGASAGAPPLRSQ